jgi:hypothetical protein
MAATVKRTKEWGGVFVEGQCPCGGEGSAFYDDLNQSAAIGYLPGDWQCGKCGQWYNASGQAIRDPQTWSPEDAGESWDEE